MDFVRTAFKSEFVSISFTDFKCTNAQASMLIRYGTIGDGVLPDDDEMVDVHGIPATTTGGTARVVGGPATAPFNGSELGFAATDEEYIKNINSMVYADVVDDGDKYSTIFYSDCFPAASWPASANPRPT